MPGKARFDLFEIDVFSVKIDISDNAILFINLVIEERLWLI
jgi:hypothetical protein